MVQVCQDQLRYRAFANDGTIVEWIAYAFAKTRDLPLLFKG